MANRILLNDGTSLLLRNGGADKLLLANTGLLDLNNGTDRVLLNDASSKIILHPDPYIGPAVPAPATFGTALQFLTDADHLESSSPVSGALYSITGWMRLMRSFPSAACRTMWSLEDAGGTTWILFQTNPSSDQMRSEDSTNFGVYTTIATDLAGDGWYFLAETHNGATPATKVYWALDGSGALTSLTGSAHGAITPAKMLLGSSDDFNNREYLEGGLNRVRVWNAELSAAEILAEMQSATVVRTSGLWASYPLASVATMLLDDSGNGRNLTNPSAAGSWQSIQGPLIGDSILTTGTVARTLGAVVSAAAGAHGVSGSSAQTLAAVTSTAAGTFPFTGTSAQTLAAVTAAASGTQGVTGASSQTLAAVVAAAAGTFPFTGSTAVTLAAVTSAAIGTLGTTGTVASTLAAVVSAASGTFTTTTTGAVSATLDPVVAAATGSFPFTGTSSQTLAPVIGVAAGALGVSGTGAATLSGLSGSAAGSFTDTSVYCVGASTLSAVVAHASGTVSVPAGYYVALARSQRLAAAATEQRAKEIRYRLMSLRRYPWFR